MFGRKKASSKASAKTSSTEAAKESTSSSKQAKGCSGKKTCSTKSCK